jgi:hypothetical protein
MTYIIVSGRTMEHEVFIREGVGFDSCYAWNVRFSDIQQERQTYPCSFHARDGTVRKGQVNFTLESAQVTFFTSPGAVSIGERGQMSYTNDEFYEITVLGVESQGDHDFVRGQAKRQFGHEPDRPLNS